MLLVLILLAAAGLRAYHLDAKSFWFDEFASAELACGRGYVHYALPENVIIPDPPNPFDLSTAAPIKDVWFSEPLMHLPPFYMMVTRLWGEVFGLGPSSLRWLSIVASLGAIAVLYLAVAELHGTTTALWAAALMAVAGPQIQYAQEARNYTLLMLEALGAAAALLRIEKRGPNFARAGALCLCVLAAALTHYLCLGTLVALAVYAVARLRGKALVVSIAAFAAAAVLWLPLGAPVALRQSHNLSEPRATEFLNDFAPGHLARTAQRFALLPVRFFTEPMGNVTAPAAVGAVAFVLAALLAWRRRELLIWALWLWLTVLPILALDLLRTTQHLEFIRYTLLAAPALYVLVAASLSDRPGKLRFLPPLLVILACLGALQAAYQTWWKADWRLFAQAIDRAERDGDVTVFWRGNSYVAYPSIAFAHSQYYRRRDYGPIVLMQDPPDPALVETLRRAPGVLVVTTDYDAVARALPGARFEWKGFEAGCGGLWRVTWNGTTTSTSPSTTTATLP
jgi:uncharacterized membrane protein